MSDFKDFFNPDDLTQWSTFTPSRFMKIVGEELQVQVGVLTSGLQIMSQTSSLASARQEIVIGDMKLEALLEECLQKCDELKLALLTTIAYAQAYDRGEINPQTDDHA